MSNTGVDNTANGSCALQSNTILQPFNDNAISLSSACRP